MAKVKFEIIRDDDNEIRAYKLGEYYLVKHYTWCNNYSWIINKSGQSVYFDCEFWEAYENGEVELVESCRDGKKILIERFNAINCK